MTLTTYTYCTIIPLLVIAGKSHSISNTRECTWRWEDNSLIINCSHRGFDKYPVVKEEIPVEHLDLSYNYIQEFPKPYADIKSLIYLNLSNNDIQEIPDDALVGFNDLRILILANNIIQSWDDIYPNITFKHARSIQKLSLAGNRLDRFSDSKGAPLLISDTLIELDISNCGITQLNNVLSGMPNLKSLSLSGNNLRTLNSLPSKSLRVLDASNCSLQWIYTSFIESVPNLQVLNLSQNPFVVLGNNQGAVVRWESLQQIDLSFCNLRWLKFSGMPNLRVAILRENRFQHISATMFENNAAVEVLDLSRNDIRDLNYAAFYDLTRLTDLDLSYNGITKVSDSQFRHNNVLQSVNLSGNKFKIFSKFLSMSLRSVIISWCEISEIDPNVFSGLPTLVSLDLSNNPITEIPQHMRSMTLKKLDLSMCRLSTIRNTTFTEFPELTSLNLSGNRFTSVFRSAYFKSNVLLNEIWLGDNQWQCDCHNSTFLAFYEYLTEEPQKLKDKNNLKCFNPTERYGRTWESTCLADRSLEIWTTILFLLLVLFVLGCYGLLIIISCCRKFLRRKIERTNRQELQENEAELEEILRQNREILEQEGQQNAPRLFDTMLPSYEDALLMPRPDRTSKSMINLSTHCYKPLSRAKIDMKLDEEEVVLDHQRFCSEEMLLNREKERTEYIATCRRISGTEPNLPRRRCFSTGDRRLPPVHLGFQNRQSANVKEHAENTEESPNNSVGLVKESILLTLPLRIPE